MLRLRPSLLQVELLHLLGPAILLALLPLHDDDTILSISRQLLLWLSKALGAAGLRCMAFRAQHVWRLSVWARLLQPEILSTRTTLQQVELASPGRVIIATEFPNHMGCGLGWLGLIRDSPFVQRGVEGASRASCHYYSERATD